MAIEALTVERRTNPIGIDIPKPRFAWRRVGVDSNARQVASQLQVVDTDNSNATWSAPTWGTGRLENSGSTYAPYGGPPLVSRHHYSLASTHLECRWIGEPVEHGGGVRGGFALGC